MLSSARCLGERGFTLLSQRWKTLQHVTASPGEIGPIACDTLGSLVRIWSIGG
jgi:hypothetical protein